MTRGYPDYSKSVGRSQRGEFLQELAFPPVWFEDKFDTPLLAWAGSSVTHNLSVKSEGGNADRRSYEGRGFMSITADTGTDGEVSRTLAPPPKIGYIACEVVFRIQNSADFEDSANSFKVIHFEISDGAGVSDLRVYYNPRSGVWNILDETGSGFVQVATQKLYDDAWHIVKLTFDLVNLKYIELQVNSTYYDLSDYSINYTSAAGGYNYLALKMEIVSDVGDNAEIYVANYKITYGES